MKSFWGASLALFLGCSGAAWAQAALELGLPVEGRLEASDRRVNGKHRDVLSFQARRGETYTIDLMSADFDPLLMVEGPGGLRESNDDGGEGLNSRIVFTARSSGVVRVIATSYSEATGGYTILVNDAASLARAAAPRAITPGEAVSGRLHVGNAQAPRGGYSQDWAFEAQAGQRFTATLTSSEFDAYLIVRGPGGLSQENDDYGGRNDSRVDFVVAESGRHTLTATSYAPRTSGNYSLTLRQSTVEEAAEALAAVCDDLRAPPSGRLAACQQRVRDTVGRPDAEQALALAARGRAHYAAGNNLAAIGDYESAARLDPNAAASFLQDHAMALHDQGAARFDANPPNYGEAFTFFDRAIALKPDYYLPYSNRGQVYGRWGLHDMALVDLNRGIELAPQNPRAWEVRGTYYRSQGNTQAARADFDRALALDPNYERGYRARGMLLRAQRNHSAAIADFSQMVRINPRSEFGYRMRGWSRYDLRDWSAAESDFAQATALSRTADGFYGLAASRHNQSRYQEALTAYQTVLSIEPGHADALHNHRELSRFVVAEAERDRLYQQCLDQQRAQREAQERRALGDAAIGLAGVLTGASQSDVRSMQQLNRVAAGETPSAPASCQR